MSTSSSRREKTPDHRQKAPIGCISSILRLFSPRHSHKRLPSARRKDKATAPSPMDPPSATEKKENRKRSVHTSTPEKNPPVMEGISDSLRPPISPALARALEKKRSAHTPTEKNSSASTAIGGSRKPPIPARKREKNITPCPPDPFPAPEKEERKGSRHTSMIGDPPRSPTIAPEIRRSSTIDSPRRPSALVVRLMGLDDDDAPTRSPESSAEKRRRLLGALEKCDEDLKALKRIMESVKLAEIRERQISTIGFVGGSKGLDGWDSKAGEKFLVRREDGRADQGRLFFQTMAIEVLPQISWRREECRIPAKTVELDHNRWLRMRARATATTRSEAMAASVTEVWEDGMCAEKGELGRIGTGLEIDIFGELMEEVVGELVDRHCKIPLSLRACRKRLCF